MGESDIAAPLFPQDAPLEVCQRGIWAVPYPPHTHTPSPSAPTPPQTSSALLIIKHRNHLRAGEEGRGG